MIVFFLMMGLGWSASFDCSKARTSSERLVCADQTLSKLDEQLAATYKKSRDRLSKNEREEYTNSQRQWLAYWPMACTSTRRSIDSSCAQNAYRTRIANLELKSNFLGGYTGYDVHLFRAEPTQDSDFPLSTVRWSYPHLLETSGESEIEKVNHWLLPDSKEVEESFQDNGQDLEGTIQVSKPTPTLYQKTKGVFSMGHGAVHPNWYTIYDYYIVSENRPLQPSDLFVGTDWKQALAAFVFQELKNELKGGLFVENPVDLVQMIESPTLWDISTKALVIQFNIYDVGPYAAGPQSVSVPWTILHKYLTPFAKAEFK